MERLTPAALFADGLLTFAKSRKSRIRILRNTRESVVRELCGMYGRDYFRPDRAEIFRELAEMYDSRGVR